MKKQIKVNLFGAQGQRSIEVTSRGGFPTRHIKVPREAIPSIFSPVPPDLVEADRKAKRAKPVNPRPDTKPQPQPDPVVDPKAIIDVMQKMTRDADPSAVDHDWFIIDEILFVATTKCSIEANHDTLLAALRTLYPQRVQHKNNRFRQHMFRLTPQKGETIR